MTKSEQTRELIVSKSLPIFNTKGYHAASLSDITKATGITKGAIYGNFKNKDEVATAAFQKGSNIVLEQITAAVSSQTTAPLKLKAIVDYYADYVINPPIKGGCPILNTSVEADDNHPLLRAKVIHSISKIKAGIGKMIYRGIREGQIKSDIAVEQFSVFFYACIEGAIVMARAEGSGHSYEFIKKQLHQMIDDITV